MEVSGTVLRQLTCISGAGTDSQSFSRRRLAAAAVAVAVEGAGGSRSHGAVRGIRVSTRPRMDTGFCDNGHLQYYRAASPPSKFRGRDKQKVSAFLTTKKKLKLLKGLSKGLFMASELGFSMDSEKSTLLYGLQGKLNLDAAEVLLKQLEQLRAEEKEMKRKKKQEKAKLKASIKKTSPDCESESSSSSSSSESTDSDCGETVDISSLRASVATAPSTTANQLESPVQEATMHSPLSSMSLGGTATANQSAAEISGNDAATGLWSCSVSFKDESSIATTSNTALQKRIEVCMGNKCKRSGAPALLQEFERVMGAEGTVVGCKCMGKCKSGPNVRVQNSAGDGIAEGLNNDSVMIPANPLCIGVSLEDVEAIVASFFGKNQSDIGLDAAAAI